MKAHKPNEKKRITVLYIKNMVCDRCIRVVKDELERIGLDVRSVVLGEVIVAGDRNDLPLDAVQSALERNGFELIEDRKAKTIERVKIAILRLVHWDAAEQAKKLNYSEYLSAELGMEYQRLSALFSSVENITIERYIILQRIERVKELLKYGEMTLSEIAFKLGYSSVQHLSNQFRQITGLTPTSFRSMTTNLRKPIDRVTSS